MQFKFSRLAASLTMAVVGLGSVVPTTAAQGTWEIVGPPPGGGMQFWDVEVLDGRLFAFGNDGVGVQAFEIIPSCSTGISDPEWRPLARKPGTPKSYFRAAALGGSIYLPGGGLAGSASTDELAIFTPDPPGAGPGTWTFGPPTLEPVNGYALATVGDEIFLSGGCCANKAFLDVFDGGWRREDPGMLTPARNHLAGVEVEGRFMALGGYIWSGGPTVCDVDVRDGGTTYDGPTLPLCRSGHAAVSCGDLVTVVGGVDATGSFPTRVDILDTASDTWTLGPPMLGPAGWASATWFEGRLWVFPLDSTAFVQAFTPDTGACRPSETLRACACDLAANRNHGQYVSCVAHVTQEMVKAGTMTREERQEILTEAAQSDIGKR